MLLTITTIFLRTDNIADYRCGYLRACRYTTTGTQTSSFTKKECFEMERLEIFTGSFEMGREKTFSIKPSITTKTSLCMYSSKLRCQCIMRTGRMG